MNPRMTAAILVSILSSSLLLQAGVVAYWRFEEGPLGANLPRGGLPDGVFHGVVIDSSGHENALSAWSQGGYAGYAYRSDVAASIITQAGERNLFSVQNTGGFPVLFTGPAAPIHTLTPEKWTIEASFKPEVGGYRTIVGRDSIGAAWEEYALAALYLQIIPGDAVAIKYCDVYGYWHQAVSAPGLIQGFNFPNTGAGHWYHLAAVCDGGWLLLYLADVDAGTGYQLVAATDLTSSGSPDTTMTAGFGAGSDWVAGTWSVGRGLYNGGHTDRAWGFIDEVRISDEPLRPDQFLFNSEVETPPFTAEPFRIAELGTGGGSVVEHAQLTGDDRGGIAISDSQVFYTGDSSTARFQASDLSGGTTLGVVHDSMVSDLRTGTVYLLGNGDTPLGYGGGVVTSLLELDGATGFLTGERIDLSTPVGMSSTGSGIFAGYGVIVLHTAGRVHRIELPSGFVRTLGPLTLADYRTTENWAIWGVAENIGGDTFLAYVKDSQTIARTRVSDGLTLPIAGFSDLSDMACFTLSVPLGRWYFHYEGNGQFGGVDETLGYAEATLDLSPSNAPFFLLDPQDLTVVEGEEASMRPVYAGSPPFTYQWRKDGVEIQGATNASLHLAASALSDAGGYSVVVSNAHGSASSLEATLLVIPEEDAVAIFNDPRYVYEDPASPLRNIQASLRSLGFATTTFSSIPDAASRFRRWVIPPLEYGDPSQDLTHEDRLAFSNFVQQGGSILILGEWSGNALRTVNDIFGMNLQPNYNYLSEWFDRAVGTYATEFEDDPEAILRNYDTIPLRSGSLPETGRALYRSGSETAVALVEQGDGVILYLGWMWWDAEPSGSQDGGWLQVLESAVRQPAPLAPAPPLIVEQPRSRDALTGNDVSLHVRALGSRPLSYQWSREGNPIADATNAVLTLTAAQPSDAGSYTVAIFNAVGGAVSEVAHVRVGDIALLTPLKDQTIISLDSVSFGVAAIATTDDLAYRWYKDGVLIEGATNEYLQVDRARFSDLGTYTVEVFNSSGLAVESRAELRVVPPVGGDVDFSFNPGSAFDGDISALAVQSDGKVLLAGGYRSIAGAVRPGLARLRPDGSVDPAFMNDFDGVEGWISAILPLPNSQVIVGGDLYSVNGEPRTDIALLNPDGSLDASLEDGLSRFDFSSVACLAMQADGKILAGGYFESFADSTYTLRGIVRLNADGSFDESYSARVSDAVNSIAMQEDGKAVIGGYFQEIGGVSRRGIARLNPDGSLDGGFQNGMNGVDFGAVHSIVLQPDGNVLIGGYFQSVNGVSRNGIARLNGNGSLDGGFQGQMSGVESGGVYALAVQPDGKVLVGGDFQVVNGVARRGIARLLPDGALDTGFQQDMSGVDFGGVLHLAPIPAGRVLIGGYFSTVNGEPHNSYARLNPDGSLDAGFRQLDGVNGGVEALAVQPDGQTVIGGYFTSVGGTLRKGIARLNQDGSLDETFQNGMTGLDGGFADCIALQPDGRIMVGGYFQAVNGLSRNGLARLNPDGSLDESFRNWTSVGDYRVVRALAIQEDGKVLVGGYFQTVAGAERYGIARLTADGSLDAGFQNQMSGVGYGEVRAMALRPDGKVLIGGSFQAVNGVARSGIARLHPNGALDTGFQPGMNGEGYEVHSIAVQTDGRVLIGGYIDSGNGRSGYGVMRLNTDGSPDETFLDGWAGEGFTLVNAVALQHDGRILVGGYFRYLNDSPRYGIARLEPDGSVDASFQQDMPGVQDGTVSELALASDGKVLIGGYFITVNGEAIGHVARLWSGPPAALVITLPPRSQRVQQGDTALFEVAATGEPELHYQWYREQERLAGETMPTLVLENVQENDQAVYWAAVSNPFEAVFSPEALLTVNQPPVADAGASIPLIVSGNGVDAPAILDGSLSYDPDGDALEYVWLESGTVLAEGRVAAPVLPVGAHTVELRVSDGSVSSTDVVAIEIIAATDAIARLRESTMSNLRQARPLVATLNAAIASIGRGDSPAAINQLLAFQKQVRALWMQDNPDLAQHLLDASREVLVALTAGKTNPGGQPRGRRVTLAPKPDSAMRVEFVGLPLTRYIIEASTNLLEWEGIGVVTCDPDGSGVYADPAAAGDDRRFYRILLP